eukprot:TRINITY_DN2776_c0_g1_i1.p1 TRINITY_DN2776_c0_g1~~TRINITY_DN2776_c0_g1_i1.p1  ORF type:complete len:418 (-),score=98.11 TRINITY_DN2776_c0_g1_i1:113-1264(-)
MDAEDAEAAEQAADEEAVQAAEQAADEEAVQVPPHKIYFYDVGQKLAAAGQRNVVERFAEANDVTVEEHIEAIFEGSGMQDAQARKTMLEQALLQQQQFLKEKKAKRSEKLTRVNTKILQPAMGASSEDNEGAKLFKPAHALAAAALFEVSEMTTQWTQVQAFRSRMEALRFIVACQPFDYKPVGEEFDDFPRFQTSRDQLAYLMEISPEPGEFVSTEPMFKRRLRVRKTAPNEQKNDVASKMALKKHRLLVGRMRDRAGYAQPTPQQHQMAETKCWLVEAAGVLFEKPKSVRDLREVLQRYFVAVSPEIEKKVLAEGFRVRRRCSIPCSATPQEVFYPLLSHATGGACCFRGQREARGESQGRSRREETRHQGRRARHIPPA